MKESLRVLAALGAALAAGSAIAALGDARLVRAAEAVAPLGTLWVNAIRMTVIPLVVSLLITAVASAADLRTVGRIGGRTLLVFGLLLVGTAALVVPLAPLAFRLAPHGAAGPAVAPAAGDLAPADAAPGLASWLVSLVPVNPIAAAAEGAMLPLIVFTLLLALAIARSPAAARQVLVGFFRALGEAMLVLVRWIVALAPVGVFALVLPLAARGGFGLAGSVGVYVVVYSLASLLVVGLLYVVAVVGGRVPLRRFARAALPPQLIAFSSSSSIAALPSLVEAAEKDLALPESARGFVLPLAVTSFKIAAPVSWTIGALFVAQVYGVELGARDLATIAFAAVFLSFAGVGVPRGAFLLLTPLFLAVGLPAEGIGLLIAVDAIPDLFATVLNVTGDLTAAVLVARGEKG